MRVLWVQSFSKDPGVATPILGPSLEAGRSLGFQIDIMSVGAASIDELRRSRRQLRRIAADYDVIHSQYGSFCGFVVADVPHQFKILTLRGSDFYRLQIGRPREKLHSQVATRLTRYQLGKFHIVTAVSHRMAAQANALLKRRCVKYLPTPLAQEFADYVGKPLSFANAKNPVQALIASVSAANSNKRIDLTKAVEARVKREIPNFSVDVVSGRSRADVINALKGSSVILCLSQHEGWPNIVKEGLAMGVPYVATDVGDLESFAMRTGAGVVVEPEPDKIASAVISMVRQQPMFDIKSATEDFMPEIFASRLLEVYQARQKCP